MIRTDALTLIRQAQPGTALYGREQRDAGAWEVAWYIREESARIARLGAGPAIEVRAGAIEQAGITLIPVLVRIGAVHPESIYESWLNAHQPETAGLAALGDLATQPQLAVHLVGDRGAIERSLAVGNRLQGFAREVLTQLRTQPPWSMAAFDAAREEVYARHPTVHALWLALSSEPQP